MQPIVDSCGVERFLANRSRIVNTSPNERRTVLFSGRVQGVGFRYTVHRLARDYDVTGFVKNLPDGRVHLVVEGQMNELSRFLEDVACSMSGYIRDTAANVAPATGQFREFSIRFWGEQAELVGDFGELATGELRSVRRAILVAA